jgi:hypothetical protein
MRYIDLLESSFTADEAKAIGDCAVIAISHITGLDWDTVWNHAQKYFRRFGMNAGATSATLRDLGWKKERTYHPLLGLPARPGQTNRAMTVRQAQAYLAVHDPDVRLLCVINAGRVPHSIAFVNGQFHNVLGAWNARIKLADVCVKS